MMIRHFRRRRPLSAREALRPGAERWYIGSVLHVIFPDSAMADPVARSVINEACANYSFSALQELDAISDVYATGSPRRDSVAAALNDT
jgi:hypothetical protein